MPKPNCAPLCFDNKSHNLQITNLIATRTRKRMPPKMSIKVTFTLKSSIYVKSKEIYHPKLHTKANPHHRHTRKRSQESVKKTTPILNSGQSSLTICIPKLLILRLRMPRVLSLTVQDSIVTNSCSQLQ